MTEEFGSGPELTQELDFTIGSTGDIATVRGIDELEKDLSISMILVLDEYVGSRPTPNMKANLRRDVRETALADARISRAPANNINITKQNYEEIEITMTIITNTGEEFELVFSA